MRTVIKPTVGRKVWYRPGVSDFSVRNTMTVIDGQPLDATVVAAHGDRCVNLVIFDAIGEMHVRTSVPLMQQGDAMDTISNGYAEWMPYQLGLAKAQAPEVTLGADGRTVNFPMPDGSVVSHTMNDDELAIAKLQIPAPAGGSMITFADFVQYGRDHGANIVAGMPWSFQYLGHPVTHENDQCYLVGSNPSLRFTPDDVLRTNSMGELSVECSVKPA